MTVAKVSVGSVLNPGQQFITLVPTNAPLEVEANIAGSDDGHVSLGDPVDIKFDTFQYSRYGLAHGIVRTISPDSFSQQGEQRNPTGAVQMPQQSQGVWYRSRITLDQIDLHNTPAELPSDPRHAVTADIRVGKADRASLHAWVRRSPWPPKAMREP